VQLFCSAWGAIAATPCPAAAQQGTAVSPFEVAIAKGTRTAVGLPGPTYWQQRAKYQITAALNHGGREVAGQETVTYFNYSPDTLNTLVVQLYQNLHTFSGVAGTTLSVTGGVHLDQVVVGGVRLENRRDLGGAPAYRVDGTMARLSLPQPLRPGDSLNLEFAWRFTLPLRDRRMGTDGEVFMVGYWYPQVAVFDDVNGWDTDQYTGRAEFYMGYADYDVELDVPSGWLVGATGELVNAQSVLGDSVLDRLAESRRAQRVTHIVTERDRGAGRATRVGENGLLRWHFAAHETRDFAWIASDRYLWDATSVVLPSSAGASSLDTVNVSTLYRPSAKAWAFADGFAARVLEFYAHYLWPYPYSQLTVAEGPWGGMEYPMFTVIYPYKDTLGLFAVEAHEIGHMWFPMQVGSNEKRSPWQDEGLTQFDGHQAIRALVRPPADPELNDVKAYCDAAKRHVELPMQEHGDAHPSGLSYGVASYAKPVAMLRALRAILGDSVFLKGYREYGRRWQFRHPLPLDFFQTFSDVAGQDLLWFWREWYVGTAVLDQALGKVSAVGDSVEIVVENRGEMALPVVLDLTRTDSSHQRLIIPVDPWLRGQREVRVRLLNAPGVVQVVIDPDHWFPDMNRGSQSWHAN